MSFLNGRVSFVRLRATAVDFPCVDDAFLEKLRAHKFQESPAPRIGVNEAGFVTGVHMLDSAFSYEKNSFGNVAHFALRIDSHAVPGDLKKALRVQHEQWAAKASATGFASRADKADAKDAAEKEIGEQLATGKFRKSKMVPVMWDFDKSVIYCGCSSNAAVEELAKIMRDAFGVKVSYLSAGALAAEIVSESGVSSSAFDDLRPSAFTLPPPVADEDPKSDRSIPGVPWVAKGKDLRDFLGDEFLLWLLFTASEGSVSTNPRHGVGAVKVTPWRSADLECAWGITGKTAIRTDGSPVSSPAFSKALNKGQWPRKAGMLLANGENGFELSLHGSDMSVSGCALPAIDEADSERELQQSRIMFILELSKTMDAAFAAFLSVRTSPEWARELNSIQSWI